MLSLTETDYGPIESQFVQQALNSQRLEGQQGFTKKVHQFFLEKYGMKFCYFTPSCTDALELAAIGLNLGPSDEVLVPSYTFPSSAHAFALRGCQLVLVDSMVDHPNLDLDDLEAKLTPKTKAVCVVHYGGASVDMVRLMSLAQRHGFYVIEDAAQAIDSYFDGIPLGRYGHAAAFSFHQTKNISAGEGGLCVVQDPAIAERFEIIREKGTNRAAFLRGEVDKYTCVDIGSSFVGSDLNAALLWGQLQRLPELQTRRLKIWHQYHQAFQPLDVLRPVIDERCRHNAHNYFLVLPDAEVRDRLIQHLKKQDIAAVFHYVGLHLGPYYQKTARFGALPNAEFFTSGLVRLPLYSHLTEEQVQKIIHSVKSFFI